MIVYQSPSLKLDYDQAKQQLVQTWVGFSVSEVFREGIDKTVEFVKSHSVKSLISDTLEQSVVKPEDTQYASSVMPSLFMNGLKAMAFVMPKNVLTQLSVKSFASTQKVPDNVKFFGSIMEAKSWLEKVN